MRTAQNPPILPQRSGRTKRLNADCVGAFGDSPVTSFPAFIILLFGTEFIDALPEAGALRGAVWTWLLGGRVELTLDIAWRLGVRRGEMPKGEPEGWFRAVFEPTGDGSGEFQDEI